MKYENMKAIFIFKSLWPFEIRITDLFCTFDILDEINLDFLCLDCPHGRGGIWQGLSPHIVHNPIFLHGLDSPSPPIGCFQNKDMGLERLGVGQWDKLIIWEEEIWNDKWILSQYLANSIWLLAEAKLSDSSNFPLPDGRDPPTPTNVILRGLEF